MYRIWRHPNSEFGIFTSNPDNLQDETIKAESVYTDDKLAEIEASGFNAIWIHGQLHHIIKGNGFPEFGENSDSHLEKITTLINRAAKYNIKIFIYMQPPRAIPVKDEEFWKNHMDAAGEIVYRSGAHLEEPFESRSLCTSTPKVQEYLKSAFSNLVKALPDLGGFIFISASEFPAHCYAKRNCRPDNIRPRKRKMDMVPVNCPRCSRLEPEDVVVRLLWNIRDGIRMASDNIPIIFWNWSWTMYIDPPCEEIISRLPQDVCLMADFERGGKKDLPGHPGHLMDEYSLSYAGPSELFVESMELARKQGLEVMAKLQFGTTHELATVVSLPLLGNVFKKADSVRKNKLKGFMGCWNFGNHQSANTAGFNYFLSSDCPNTEEEALKRFANLYFPGCNTEDVTKAWLKFAEAMLYYPFCIPFLYHSPTNYALALIPEPNVLNKKPAGRSWLMDERGDDLSRAITDFSLDEIINNFTTMQKLWKNGVEILRKSLKDVADNPHAKDEFGNAEICNAAWRSTRNIFKIYKLRLTWKEEDIPEYIEIISDELENLSYVLPFVKRDSRQGFHIEAHGYMFNPKMLEDKIKILKEQIEMLEIAGK